MIARDFLLTGGLTGSIPDLLTPDDALVALGRLTYLYTTDRHGERHVHLPRPDEHQAKILKALGLSFPTQAKERPAPSQAIRKKPVRKQNPIKQAA